jgi:UDP-GlcNAc3NAcA epimerase
MRIATIVGARPQFIKAAVVSRALDRKSNIRETVIHTGQHYDPGMSNVFFDQLGIPAPDYKLGVGSGPHGQQTGRMLEAIENVLLRVNPQWVLVYGDTNSTLAGALAAAKLHIPVAHVEAGLRSFNRQMPEEINRVLTDHMSDLLFAPTGTAEMNLVSEGICADRVGVVGDVMYDVALQSEDRADTRKQSLFQQLGIESKRYILATIHRSENTDNRECLEAILEALAKISKEIPVVFPVHPRTAVAIKRDQKMRTDVQRLLAIDPVGYLEMIALEKNAMLVATDSGGVQKEAFFFQVPCVTMREETEWLETLEGSCNRVAPPRDRDGLLTAMHDALSSRPCYPVSNPYGDGRTAERIVARLATVSTAPAAQVVLPMQVSANR